MKYKLFYLLLTALLFTGCSQTADDNLSNNKSQKSTIDTSTEGSAAAQESSQETEEPFVLNFEAITIEGEEVTSDIFANSRLTMLNVWATYCNPCLSEMPDLGEIASEYDPETFQMYGIISDVMEGDETDKLNEAKELITQTKADYPHLLLTTHPKFAFL